MFWTRFHRLLQKEVSFRVSQIVDTVTFILKSHKTNIYIRMDARPHRPIRAVRAQADENHALPAIGNQMHHQSHKSTSHFSSLPVGNLKNAAKRTAFGDVSNTAANAAKVQADGCLEKKVRERGKYVEFKDKSSTLLKPAQKPLVVTATKYLKKSSSSISDISQNASVLKTKQPITQVITKRTVSKRSTPVYKDNAAKLNLIIEPESLINEDTSLVPQVQPLLPTPTIEQIYENSRGDNKIPHIDHASHSSQNIIEEIVHRDAGIHNISIQEENDQVLKVCTLHEDKSQRRVSRIPESLTIPEADEYWVDDDNDEEDEEELECVEEQGYMTTHSYRSRGDNTTVGATTIPFPKITAKVKQELESAKRLIDNQRTVEEIEDEKWDTSMVAEYGDEIFAYMRELEIKMLPNAHYMDLQTEIQWSMRSVLMDWLIQVHHRFALLPETLFLCVNYVDRFLSYKIVSLGKLQLVGATAIFVAAKYEEINCPSVTEIVYMVDGGYTVEEILKAERFMLSILQFELGWPGPMSFLRRISKADEYDLETRTLAKYFLEVIIMDERFVGSLPSFIAAGAHCLARLMLRKGSWTKQHVYYSGYTWSQLQPLLEMIKECCKNPRKHHNAVYEKYSDCRYKRASQFVYSEIGKFVLPPLRPSRYSNLSVDRTTSNTCNESYEVIRRSIKPEIPKP